jgi:hypothetical protein
MNYEEKCSTEQDLFLCDISQTFCIVYESQWDFTMKINSNFYLTLPW